MGSSCRICYGAMATVRRVADGYHSAERFPSSPPHKYLFRALANALSWNFFGCIALDHYSSPICISVHHRTHLVLLDRFQWLPPDKTGLLTQQTLLMRFYIGSSSRTQFST